MTYFTVTTRFRTFILEAADREAATRALVLLFTDEEKASRFRMAKVETFPTYEEAREAFALEMDEEDCVDNFRFAFEDDSAAMAEYETARENGCCGSTDRTIMIAGRLAAIGCNYGH